jgi:hypothetical protein
MMPPATWYEPIVMPGIFTAFGLLIWALGMLAEKSGKAAGWKWFGIALLLAAMFFGFPRFMAMQDYAYRMSLSSVRRVPLAHYAGFILPLIAVIGCLGWHFLARKSTPTDATATE